MPLFVYEQVNNSAGLTAMHAYFQFFPTCVLVLSIFNTMSYGAPMKCPLCTLCIITPWATLGGRALYSVNMNTMRRQKFRFRELTAADCGMPQKRHQHRSESAGG